MIAFNNTNRRALTWIAVLIAALLVLGVAKSAYMPRPLVLKGERSEPSGFFALENNLECAPGAKRGAGWTKGLTPGGLCGSGEFIRDAASYEIESGIGGEL